MTEQLAKYTDIRVFSVVGGLNAQTQQKSLQNRPDILLSTPGRLLDHLFNTPGFHLEDVEVLILDEADRLCELGFVDELNAVLKQVGYKGQRQTMLFSATLSEKVSSLVDLTLNSPANIQIDAAESVVETLSQEFIRLKSKGEELGLEREAIVLALAKRSFKSKTIIFVQTKESCHRLLLVFQFHGLKAVELQGNLTQLQRMAAITDFKNGEVDFLICTDLASRGIDIEGVQTVINVSMPKIRSVYIHRVGRTSRAGRKGRSVTLVSENERSALKQLMKHQQTNSIRSRIIPNEIIQKFKKSILKFKEDIHSVLQSERIDKEARIAEMEANRLQNLIQYKSEIKSRPKKTWFQTQQERMASKMAMQRIFDKEDEKEPLDVSKSTPNTESDTENENSSKLSEKEQLRQNRKVDKNVNPLLGLSRAKKRRKLLQIEAEQIAKKKLIEAKKIDPSIGGDSLRVDPFTISRIAAKKAKKRLNATNDDTSRKKTKKKKRSDGDDEVHLSNKLHFKSNDIVRDRFAEQAVRSKMLSHTSKSTKKRASSGKGCSFKSKSKHKRR